MAWIYITFQTCAAAPSPIYVIYQQEWAVPAWILGFAFSAYAFTLLIAIITVGSLSDHLGRLPVLAGALALQIGAMTMLLFAQNIEVVLIARLMQGFATGTAITTLSAALTDLSPSKNRQLGAIFASVAPLIGLAVGALGSGLLIHFDPTSVPLIFTILDGLLLIGVVFVAVSPDLIAKTPGAIRSLIPRIRIPAAARSAFGASALLNIAVWLASGLSLGLVGQINRQIFIIQDGLASGGTIALQMGVASITVFVFRKMDTRRSGILASIGLAVGALVMALGITDTLFPIYLVGTAITGYGIGLGFAGYIRLLVPTVGAEDRAALFSAMYVVSYLTFGIPIIAAGFLITAFGATPVILIYVGATFIVSVLAARALRRYGQRRPTLQS
jgi:MFS family permease